MKHFIVSLFSLVLLLSGSVIAQEEMEQEATEVVADTGWVTEKMPFTYQNIQVPREMWDLVKQILESDGVSAKALEDYSLSPTTVHVELSSSDPLVLKDGKNQRLIFTEGGGDLDLFNYVPGRGKFRIRFSPHLVNEKKFHVLYISESPGKQIEGSQWGNGCGNMYDLSEVSGQFLEGEGMLVTTSKRHYLHLMAGVYVFFQLVDERLFLGYIRVMDSRYPNFDCKAS